jgi:hypothetical protein
VGVCGVCLCVVWMLFAGEFGGCMRESVWVVDLYSFFPSFVHKMIHNSLVCSREKMRPLYHMFISPFSSFFCSYDQMGS